MMRCSGLALLVMLHPSLSAQTAVVSPSGEWRAWVFGRVGAGRGGPFANTSGVLTSLAGGVAGSYGSMLAMVRATDTEVWSFNDSGSNGVQDYGLLAGLRSRGDRLFVAGAVGIAQATPVGGTSGVGTLTPDRRLAPAFDVSAHADYVAAGIALTISGSSDRTPVRDISRYRSRRILDGLDSDLPRYRRAPQQRWLRNEGDGVHLTLELSCGRIK